MVDRPARPDRSAASSMPSPTTEPPRRHPPPASESVAWLLADAILPNASQADRHAICIQLGCRHYRRAIAASLQLAVRQEISIPTGLAAMLSAWLDAYRGHDDQMRLRQLVVTVKSHSISPAQRRPPPMKRRG